MAENTTIDFFDKMLTQLAFYRNFPKYQMERRVDILISMFLPDIIREHIGSDFVPDVIIPELPIKRDTDNQSINIDYFLYSISQRTGFLIELKTDPNSCNSKQLNQYIKVRDDGFEKVMNGIRDIRKNTKKRYRKKYEYLLRTLTNNRIDPDIRLEVIFILPEMGKEKIIKFAGNNCKIHFITLEALKNLHPINFSLEWEHIVNSGIFDPEKF
jgi:hypothetical protein